MKNHQNSSKIFQETSKPAKKGKNIEKQSKLGKTLKNV